MTPRGRDEAATYAAVIVLHESRDELAALLRSLEHAGEAPRLVVVDTGRDDGGAAVAARHGAEVIERRDNPGFGAASNEGLRRVQEDVAVLLNPDCEVTGDALGRLAGIARAHPRALHAPRLLNSDGSVQRSAHPLPGTLGAFLPAVLPVLPRPLRERAEPFRAHTPRTVGWAIGACLAASRQTLRGLGPFDERIHLFGEDIDLCLRARRHGIPTVLHPQLELVHHGRHSLNRGGERFDEIARTRRAAVTANLGPRAAALDDAAQALTFAARAFKGPRERAQLKAVLKRHDPGTGPGS
jgi:N-acetylglucosaminyl-diphospho-decaprenol L-rhamnosyltransferase